MSKKLNCIAKMEKELHDVYFEKNAVFDFAQAPHILMAGNDPEEVS